MLNKVILIGNLGKNPEVKKTANGFDVASFSIATSSRRKVAEEWKDETEWHNVATFGKLADVVAQYVVKGMKVYVEGRIKTDKFETDDGQTRYYTKVIANEVKFLSKVERSTQAEMPIASKPTYENFSADISDDEIPFS